MENQQKGLKIFTQIEIFQLQSQCQVDNIQKFKQLSIKKSLQTSQPKENKELQLNSIQIDLQCLFLSLECLRKKIVSLRRFTKGIMNFLISMMKLSLCSMFSVQKQYSKREWSYLKKLSLKLLKVNKKNMKKLSMRKLLQLKGMKLLNKDAKKKQIAEKFKTKQEKKRKNQHIKK